MPDNPQRSKDLTYVRYAILAFAATLFAHSFVIASANLDVRTDAVMNAQRSYFEAIKQRDVERLASMLAPDYTGVYADGIVDRAKEISDLKAFALTDYTISGEKITFANKKTAVITFRLRVKVTIDGKDFFEDDNVVCLWTQHGNKWLLTTQSAVKVRDGS